MPSETNLARKSAVDFVSIYRFCRKLPRAPAGNGQQAPFDTKCSNPFQSKWNAITSDSPAEPGDPLHKAAQCLI